MIITSTLRPNFVKSESRGRRNGGEPIDEQIHRLARPCSSPHCLDTPLCFHLLALAHGENQQ